MKQNKTHTIRPAALAALLAAFTPQALNAAVEDVTTQYIINATFDGNKTPWNIVSNMSSTTQENHTQEFWTSDTSNGYFQMSQTANDLPDGFYRLTANGFTRSGGETAQQTCLYAISGGKEYATPLKLLHSETAAYGSTPDNTAQASEAFSKGYWLNTIDGIEVTGGKLTIGARNCGQLRAGSSNGSWTILGNVRLYRLTGSDLQPLMASALEQAGTLADGSDDAGLAEAIRAASAVTPGELTWEDIKALEKAMDSFRQTRMLAATADRPADATHLIRNAGFEDGFTPSLPTANGGYASPNGWTLAYGPTHTNNNIGRGSSTLMQSGYDNTVAPTEGGQALAARMRWTTASVLDLSQPLSLPAGRYTLAADMGNLGATETATLALTAPDGTELCRLTPSSATPSTQESPAFDLQASGTCTLRVKLVQSRQTDARMAVDNLRLTYYGTDALTPAAQAEAFMPTLNRPLETFIRSFNGKAMQKTAWETLLSRVKEAEGLKDAPGATAADLKAAAENLEAALKAARPSLDAYDRLARTLRLFASTPFQGDAAFQTAYADAQAVLTQAAADEEEADAANAALRKAYIACLVAHADGTAIDATSFISNPDFEEGEHTVPAQEFNVYEPEGWTVDFASDGRATGYKHIRAIPYGTAYDGTTPERPDEAWGGNTLYFRTNWEAAHQMRAWQEIALPAGHYRLSVGANHLSGTPSTRSSYLQLPDGTRHSLWPAGTASWETLTQEFELEEEGDVTLSFGFTTPGGDNAVKLLVDHIQLELLAPDYVSDYLEALSEAKETRGQVEEAAFPSVASAIDKAIAAGVDDGEEASFSAATGALREASRYGRSACSIELSTGNATRLIANPEADDGTKGWTVTQVSVLDKESYKGIQDNYFDGGDWNAQAWKASMTQTLYLPEGYYALSATGRCSGNATLTLTVNGDTIGFPPEGNSGGNIHAYAGENSAEAGTNNGKGYGWNRRHLAFHLAENTACTLKVEASADAPEQWFSIDGFTLSYAAAKGTAKAEDGRITASGIIGAEDLALLADEETRSADLRGLKGLIGEPDWPEDMNPNCIIYAPVGLLEKSTNIVCNHICTNLSLKDKMPFNAPEGFVARTASYARTAYTDGYPETLVLPFAGTAPEGFIIEEVSEEHESHLKTSATADETLAAGKAYLMTYSGETTDTQTTELTFTATDADIAAYEAPVEEGLFGSTDFYYVDGTTGPVYMLSATDNSFRLAAAGSYSAPFRACFSPSAPTAQANLRLIRDHTTGMASPDDGTAGNAPVNVYDTAGRLIRRNVERDEAVHGLQRGIYIINHQKIYIK